VYLAPVFLAALPVQAGAPEPEGGGVRPPLDAGLEGVIFFVVDAGSVLFFAMKVS
jgi:hypothetical protein